MFSLFCIDFILQLASLINSEDVWLLCLDDDLENAMFEFDLGKMMRSFS